MPDFGTRLRKLRKEFNLRQKDLAKEMNLAQTTIANYEKNSRFPNQKTLIQIANYFNVTLDYLLGRSNGRFITEPNQIKDKNMNYSNEMNSAPSPLAKKYMDTVLKGKKEKAFQIIRGELQKENRLEHIYSNIFTPSLIEIGRLWEENIIGVDEEHYFSQITRQLMDRIQEFIPHLQPTEKTIIGTAALGEFHEIGIKMVIDFFAANGWQTYYLGINTPNNSLINCIRNNSADLLAISATMPYNLNNVKATIKAVKSEPDCQEIDIIVGGKAFQHGDKIWKTVGADGTATDISQALELAHNLYKKSKPGE